MTATVSWLAGIIAVLVLVQPRAADAQAMQRLPRVGILAEDSGGPAPTRERFEAGLREHGYVHGTNVVLERRFAEGRLERLPELAGELVRLGVDVIVAASERGAVAARGATSVIPIVMILGVDPVAQGLAQELGRPGGNVTGLTVDPGAEILAKRLQLLRQIVPGAQTIAVLTEPLASATPRLRSVEEAAAASGVSLVRFDVRRRDELPRAFTAMSKARAEALLVSGASVLYFAKRDIADLALKHRLPAIYPLRDYTEAGGLISYGVDVLDLFRRGGGYVARILKGARPQDLPIEQPTKFELSINSKTAQALGVTIPPSLLLQANTVIE